MSSRDQPTGENLSRLADAVRAIDRLRFHRRIPPGIEQENILGRRQIQTQPAGLEADEKQLAVRIVLESIDALLAVARLPVEIFVHEPFLVEPFAHDRQKAGELREDQRLVPFVGHLGKLRSSASSFALPCRYRVLSISPG